MPSQITRFETFDRTLRVASQRIRALADAHPTHRDLASIVRQLEALGEWTLNRRTPSQDERDSLNFGLLASRSVHPLDAELAGRLYELASCVTYW